MPAVPHPIPYQGSKRLLAPLILEHFPTRVVTLYEPFAGSAAITLAAAGRSLAAKFRIGDSLAPLADIWTRILADPERLADEYESLWRAQQADPRAFYDDVRRAFNEAGGSARLLYLLARCVKNAVRFSHAGDFNQSPDNRRLGRSPARMRGNILGAHELLRGRAQASAGDYAEAIRHATPDDLVYMDPPYQGTSGSNDQRYHQSFDRPRFVADLEGLLDRGVPFLVSLDGRTGAKTYGPALPAHLGLARVELHAGRSSQATLSGRATETYESLYLSPALATAHTSLLRSTRESAPGASDARPVR
jgi:DNA adenine methylase